MTIDSGIDAMNMMSGFDIVEDSPGNGTDRGHGLCSVKWSMPKKRTFLTKAVKDAPPNLYQSATQAAVTTTEGRQVYATLSYDFDKVMFDRFAASAINAEKKVWFDSIQHIFCFANTTNVPVTFDVYYNICKKNTSNEPVSAIADGAYLKFNGTADMFLHPYMEPTLSNVFTYNFYIRKHTTFHLSPGQVGKINIYRQMNLMYDTAMVREGDIYMRNVTGFITVKLLGTPVTNGTDITFPVSKVITTKATRVKYRYPIGQGDDTMIGQQDGDWATDKTNLGYMNEDTGAKVLTGTV